MANITASLKDWSTTEASNQPDSTDSATLAGDLRAIQAGVRDYFSQSTIASAATCDIGANDAGYLSVSGTTTITAFGTVSAGIVKRLKFDGALTLTHNATSLILPSGANITTAAGDTAEFESLGSGNWLCLWYTKANGSPVSMATPPAIGGTTPAAGTFTTLTSTGNTNIGDAAGDSHSVKGSLYQISAALIGYSTGSGGAVTQLTSKSTGVTLNTPCGQITTHNAALAAGATVTFSLTNSFITTSDTILVNIAASGNYSVRASVSSGSSSISLTNTSGGSLGEAVFINFAIIKGAVS